jgi:hypothetical protein
MKCPFSGNEVLVVWREWPSMELRLSCGHTIGRDGSLVESVLRSGELVMPIEAEREGGRDE